MNAKIEHYDPLLPLWPKPATPTTRDGNFKPQNTLAQTMKVSLGSGLLLGGMHIRRILQRRKGSARPGLARYLDMFTMSRGQLVGLPVALGTYAFCTGSLYNLQEGSTASAEFVSAGLASFIGLSIGSIKSNKFGKSLGMAVFFAIANWAGGLGGLGVNSYKSHQQRGELRKQKSQDDDWTHQQGFWDVIYRRPLSQTVEVLGEGRGILKP